MTEVEGMAFRAAREGRQEVEVEVQLNVSLESDVTRV